MKNKISKNIHFLIVLWALWGAWGSFEEFKERKESTKGQLDSTEIKINRGQRRLKKLKKYEADHDELKKNIDELKSKIDETKKKLPNTTNDPEILGTFKDEANSLNIKNIFLEPKSEREIGFYYGKEYEFKGAGTWLQYLIFLERLAKKDRIFNTKRMRLIRSREGSKGRFQMIDAEIIFEAYRYNPNFSEEDFLKQGNKGK